MGDSELESESDEEKQMQDVLKLTAALNDDEPCTSTSKDREQYSNLETLSELNKMYDDKLRHLENVLRLRLQECRQKLKEEEEDFHIKKKKLKTGKEKIFRYVTCGKPYFKDKSNFPAPDNEDTILMRKSQMYDFSIVSPVTGWTDKEKTKFLNVLLKMSQDKKKIELNSKIAAVRRECKGQKMSSTNENKISTLKREIDMVEQKELKDLALPLDEEYDWDCVANKLSYRHNPLEYKAFWKLYLHPTINKAPWSTSEHMSLLKIASDENLQNWKKIASILGTGRSSFQCFVYFRTNVSHPYAGKKWTQEEEEYLKRIVEYYRAGDYIPWGKVASAMDNRTKVQIYNKYSRLIEFRKGRFLKEEDEVILICNEKFGANFKKIARFLPGRSSGQCRIRFQILQKKCVSTVWTVDEDRKLVEFLSNQNSSANYSGIAQHFPDKDRQNIRSRCITLKRWMKVNPNVDIVNAPRRASRNLGHGVLSRDLYSAVKRLKTRIELEVNYKRIKIINTNSAESDIDNAIKVLIKEEHKERNKTFQTCHALMSSDDSNGNKNPTQYNKPNSQNLRKCLMLLRTRLDKNKLLESPLAEKYKGLFEPDQDFTPVKKVKSYSRKKPETILKVGLAPDVWGTKGLPPPTYVFPPNYSTITALEKIMLSTATTTTTQTETNEEPTNFDIFKKTPSLSRDENGLLKERFNTLFLWPMLLTSQSPEGTDHYVEQNLPKKKPRFATKDNYTIVLPKPRAKDKVQNVIDLEESASTSTANLDFKKLSEIKNFGSKKF